jgi:hypothetical protein
MKAVQLPDDLYQRAAKLAESDHVSVDELVAALVNEGVGEWSKCMPAQTTVPSKSFSASCQRCVTQH